MKLHAPTFLTVWRERMEGKKSVTPSTADLYPFLENNMTLAITNLSPRNKLLPPHQCPPSSSLSLRQWSPEMLGSKRSTISFKMIPTENCAAQFSSQSPLSKSNCMSLTLAPGTNLRVGQARLALIFISKDKKKKKKKKAKKGRPQTPGSVNREMVCSFIN